MFDAYPDQTTIWQIQARIQKQAADSFPPEILQNLQNMQEEAPEVFSMQYQDGRRRRPGDNWMGDLVRVMLLQGDASPEMAATTDAAATGSDDAPERGKALFKCRSSDKILSTDRIRKGLPQGSSQKHSAPAPLRGRIRWKN